MYKDVANDLDLFIIEYPNSKIAEPAEKDYNLGFIRRYFVQKANDTESTIYEVSQEDYSKYLQNPFWKAESIKWRILGPRDATFKKNGEMDDRGVLESNKAAIGLASKTLPNIKLYLPNLLQFYKK